MRTLLASEPHRQGPTAAELMKAEVQTLFVLHKSKACAGEPISVALVDDRQGEVQEMVPTAERKREILDVQEFKVQQSNFSADIGFGGSTVINVVTRSGSNDLHGSAYWFVRNNILTANDWFANAYGQKMAGRHYSLFGGNLGGPIKKDKTFYFFSIEGLMDLQAMTFRAGGPQCPDADG